MAGVLRYHMIPQPTGSGRTIKMLGIELKENDEDWHWVMAFPLVPEKDKADFEGPMDDPLGWREKIFTSAEGTGAKERFTENMTKRQFHECVREEIVNILCGAHCGMKVFTQVTIDEDELLVKISLSSLQAKQQIAHHEQYRMPLKIEAYTKDNPDGQCPTTDYREGVFDVCDVKTPYGALKNYVPAHINYTVKRHDLVKDFREVDLIRLCRRRMREFFDPAQLLACGVVLQVFPVHRYRTLDAFYGAGWNNWKAWCQYPGQAHNDFIRDYFGEEVAFFFHWYNFFTRYCVFAGVVGLITFAYVRISDDGAEKTCVQLGFAVFMCLWGACYTKHYARRSNSKIVQWGMSNYNEAAARRHSYRPLERGTWRESIQKLLHWLLVSAFILLTLVVVWLISSLRIYCGAHLDDHVFLSFSGKQMNHYSNFMITAYIKIVDTVWMQVSPRLTENENWVTDQDCKGAKIVKLFCVKAFLYYYPFLYIAFLKEPLTGADADACLEELLMQIYVYYPIEAVFAFIFVLLPLAQTWHSINKEMKEAAINHPNKKYTYIEFQAKCPRYIDDIDDIMYLVLSLGFLMMFSVLLPVMPTLALLSNLCQIRLIAYRLSFASQRPDPRGQEGIGAWVNIVQAISFIGVFTNVGLAVFMMRPLRDEDFTTRCLYFLLGEHCMIGMKLFIMALVPGMEFAQQIIQEHNSHALTGILWSSNHSTHDLVVPESGKPNVALDRRLIPGDGEEPLLRELNTKTLVIA